MAKSMWNHSSLATMSTEDTSASGTETGDNSESDGTESSRNSHSHSIRFRKTRSKKNNTVFTVQGSKYMVDEELESSRARESRRDYKLFRGHHHRPNGSPVIIKVMAAKCSDHDAKRGDALRE